MWIQFVPALPLLLVAAPALAGAATRTDTASAGRPEVRRESAPAVPRLDSARAQLQHADLQRRALRGLDEPARQAARLRAADAYRAVRDHFPGDAAACAEASFRRAELLRQGDEIETARAEYRLARERGARTPWRVRAGLELGHLERRAKRHPEALAAYEAVIADAAASASQRDDASLWSARVLADQGRSADAIRVWTRVADAGDDPLDRIRAYDQWALELVARADLEGAAGVLARCREQLADAAQEETRLGERVRAALGNLRAVEDLARAVEQRRRGPAGG